ncbi:MAG: threonine ammonia-lyase [Oscillospiraceae bacterium]|jgi:threonine dehydratase|nr:threonine ammonia-lyase [Oscillospiraceae bacterium]
MSELTLNDMENAVTRLSGVLHKTPLQRSDTFSKTAGTDIYLKYENQQKTGSFKIRGAYNKLWEIKQSGNITNVLAASAGNHAQGVAYAATVLDLNATIVMPKSTPIAKIKATEGYNAEVVLSGDCYDSACKFALELAKERNAEFIHPFDDKSVIAGQGTIGYEILKDLPGVDVVFVPAGGGGLLSGISFFLKSINPRIRIVGVQSEGADAIYHSFKEKKLVSSDKVCTIADGIAVRTPGTLTTEIISKYTDDIITVNDNEISSAILTLLERCKQLVEPAGAASIAGALKYPDKIKGQRCVCLLSGGNIDMGFVHKLIDLGLAARGRKLKFKTVLTDVPGSLEKVSKIIGESFANIVRIQYDRTSADLNPQDVFLHITCEVSDNEHGKKVCKNLENSGYRIITE